MMKTVILTLTFALLFPPTAFCADAKLKTPRIRMIFDSHEVVVSMFDSPAGRDFMSLLPLQVEFNDFAGKEKIAYLPRKLDASDAPASRDAQGDFTYYRPWGNLAVFYKGFGGSDQLTVLGRIESGKERFAAMSGPFSARIEKIERPKLQ